MTVYFVLVNVVLLSKWHKITNMKKIIEKESVNVVWNCRTAMRECSFAALNRRNHQSSHPSTLYYVLGCCLNSKFVWHLFQTGGVMKCLRRRMYIVYSKERESVALRLYVVGFSCRNCSVVYEHSSRRSRTLIVRTQRCRCFATSPATNCLLDGELASSWTLLDRSNLARDRNNNLCVDLHCKQPPSRAGHTPTRWDLTSNFNWQSAPNAATFPASPHTTILILTFLYNSGYGYSLHYTTISAQTETPTTKSFTRHCAFPNAALRNNEY